MGCDESKNITEEVERTNHIIIKSANISSFPFSDFYCKFYNTIKKVNSKVLIKDITRYHQCILHIFFKADLCSKLYPFIEILKLNKSKYLSSIQKIVELHESNQVALLLYKSFMELETATQIKFIGVFIILIGQGSVDSKIRILSQHIMFFYSGGKNSIESFIFEFQNFNISLFLHLYENSLSTRDFIKVQRFTNHENIENICFSLNKSYQLSEIYYINKLLTWKSNNNTVNHFCNECINYSSSMIYSHQRNIIVEFLIENLKYFEFGYLTKYLVSSKNN